MIVRPETRGCQTLSCLLSPVCVAINLVSRHQVVIKRPLNGYISYYIERSKSLDFAPARTIFRLHLQLVDNRPTLESNGTHYQSMRLEGIRVPMLRERNICCAGALGRMRLTGLSRLGLKTSINDVRKLEPDRGGTDLCEQLERRAV